MSKFRSVYDPGDALIAGTVAAVDAKFPVSSANIQNGAVIDTKLATDAVTNPKVAPAALDGETITGAVFQTSTPGAGHPTIMLDGPNNLQKFYSGISGETPGSIDPSPSGGSPRLILAPGTTATLTEQPSITMLPGGVGTSSASVIAGNLFLQASAVQVNATLLAVNGVGSGAGMDTWQVACTANSTATSTTNVTITGFSQTVPVPSTFAVYMVHFDIAWATAGGTSSIIELLVDGTPQTAQMTQSTVSTDSLSAHKMWRITGLSVANHTFTGRVRNTAGATTAIVGATNSLMTIERKG